MYKQHKLILGVILFVTNVVCVMAKGTVVNNIGNKDFMQNTNLPVEFSKIISLSIDSMLLNEGFRYKIFKKKSQKSTKYIWFYERDNTKYTNTSDLINNKIVPQTIKIAIGIPSIYVSVASDKDYKTLNTALKNTIRKTFTQFSKKYNDFDKYVKPSNISLSVLRLTYNYDLQIQFQDNNYMVLLQTIVLSDKQYSVTKRVPIVYNKIIKKNMSLEDFFVEEKNFSQFKKHTLMPYIKNVLYNRSDNTVEKNSTLTNTGVNEVIDDLFIPTKTNDLGLRDKLDKTSVKKNQKKETKNEFKIITDETALKFTIEMYKKRITAIIFYFDQNEVGTTLKNARAVRYPVSCVENKIKKFQCRLA